MDGAISLIGWSPRRSNRVHACLESTGRFSLGIACALHEAGHVVSIVNPAQIRDFARTKLGRNKTDGVDASHIREYCDLFKPQSWTPPSNARRTLGELQTIRAGIIADLTQWKNRRNSGMVNAVAQSLADVTISHFARQLEAVDEAIAQTIDDDPDLRRQCDLLLSIGGVGETLAGVVLAELPAVLRSALYMPAMSAMRYNRAIVALVTRLKAQGRLKPKQIVVAAMRKLLVLCFGVLKTGKPFDPAIAMGC
jgi:transposase